MLPALVAFLARLLTGPRPIDDAYITFRYARNLAEGLGLVYNPGEWVLGTTAPLWAIVLAAGYRIGLTDLPQLATTLSAVCDAATAMLLVRLALRMGWRPLGAALVGLAWALNPMSIAFATGGMETSVFVLLSLVVLSLTAQGRFLPLAAALAGAATLVRPEGALLAFTVVAWTWLTRRSTIWRVAPAAAAPMALAGAAIFLRYGSPLPNSVAAKQVAYLPAWPLENAVALLVQAGLPGWSTYLLAVVPTAVGLVLALAGLAALVELTRRAVPWPNRWVPGPGLRDGTLARRDGTLAPSDGTLRLNDGTLAPSDGTLTPRDGTFAGWLPFAAFGVLYLAFYVVAGLRGVRLFPWYLVPIAPFYLLAAAAGLARLSGGRRYWLAALLVAWQLPAVNWHEPLMPSGEDLAREQLYLDVGHDLALRMPSGAVLAAPEIGALGYASGLRVLDTVGLISPAALPYYPLPASQLVTDNAIPARLIADRQPDVVVTLDAFAQRSLLPDADFQRDYRLEVSYPATVWQSHELLVFRRRS